MSEIVFATLRSEHVHDVALRRLKWLAPYDEDLFKRVAKLDRQVDAIREMRMARQPVVSLFRKWLRYGVRERIVAKALFLYDFLGEQPHLSPKPELQGAVNEEYTRRIVSATGINYSSALVTPLAFTLLYNLDPLTPTQMIIAVDGLAGVGKTSLVYNSIKALLLALGFSEKEAQELFLAMYIQRVEEFIALLGILKESEAYRRVRLPILVFDDAAATASAYMWFTESRRKMIEFARALTIARERVANIVMIGPYSAIFKGLRRLAHIVFEPSTYYDILPMGRRLIVTLWRVNMQGKEVDLTATVTPHPMKVDDTVYSLITAVKKKIWEEITEKAATTVEESAEESGEKEDE
jgi:hypothetical protein